MQEFVFLMLPTVYSVEFTCTTKFVNQPGSWKALEGV